MPIAQEQMTAAAGSLEHRLREVARRGLEHPRWPIIVAALSIVLTLPSLRTGFIVDDYFHRATFLKLPGFATDRLDIFSFVGGGAPRPEQVQRVSLPWWAADDLKLSFWRPVTALTHILDYALWRDAAWLMHLHSLLWYAAGVLLVSLLFRQLMDVRWQAGLAAFAYAVSHTHAMPVFFLANRNALIGVFFGLGALLLHHRWRQHGRRDAAWLAPLALLCGLLSNEGALAVCGYLLAYALFIDRATWRSRAASLAPSLLIVIAWRVVYQLQGYGASSSEAYIDPIASPSKFVRALVVREPLYLLAQWAFPPTDWSILVSPATLSTWWLVSVGFLALLVLLFLPLLRADRTTRFWFAGMVLSLVPSCATFPMDRMLLHSGIGGPALLVQFAAAVYSGRLVPSTARIRHLAVRGIFDLFVTLHLIISPVWLPLRIATTASLFGTMTHAIERLAERADLSGKLVIVVDDTLRASPYFPVLRALAGLAPAERLLVLAPVASRFDPVVMSRASANTLIMDVDGSYLWLLERDSAHPFKVGDTVDLRRLTAEVLRVREGRPTRVAFHFDSPLEDASIAWFGRVESASNSALPLNGRYRPWRPPSVGETVSVR